jgi:hypothetical protein
MAAIPLGKARASGCDGGCREKDARMRIVNPTYGIAPQAEAAVPAGAVDWANDPIILFSNNKPNARELLEGVRDRLAALRRVDNVDTIAKHSASQPAPTEMIEDVARKYRIALLALGD